MKGVQNSSGTMGESFSLSKQIYGMFTNSIANVKEPFSKDWNGDAHVLNEAKGVGIKESSNCAHAKTSDNLMGVDAT